MSRSAFAAALVGLLLIAPMPAVADAPPDATVELWRAQPSNDGLAVAVARKYVAAGQYQEALACLQQCVATPGKHPQARAELGWLSYQHNLRADAIALLRKALAEGAGPQVRGQLAWVLAADGQRADAIKTALEVRKLKEATGKGWALAALGLVADDAGRARAYLQEAISLDPDNALAHYWLARRSPQGTGFAAYCQALTLVARGGNKLEHDLRAELESDISSELAARPERYPAWITTLESLVLTRPDDEILSANLVDAYRQTAKPELAIAELRRRLGVATDKAKVLHEIARLHEELEQDQVALETCERALKLVKDPKQPGALEIRCFKAKLLLNQGREADAVAELDRILADVPEYREAKLLRSLTYALKRDWGQAAKLITGLEPVTADEHLLVNFVRRQDGKSARWTKIF